MNPDSAGQPPLPPPPSPSPSAGAPPILPPPAPAFPPPPVGSAWPPPTVTASNSRSSNTGLIIAIVVGFLLLVGGATIFALIKLAPTVQTALGRIKTPEQQRREREALQKLNEAKRESVAEQRRALDAPDGDTITGSTERVDRARAMLDETAKQFKGDDRKAMEVVQVHLAVMRDKTQVYETAANTLKQAGFFSPATLTTKDAINARRELAKKWIAANDDLALCLGTLESNIRTDLEKTLSARDSASTMARGFARGANIERLLKIRDYDRQMGNSLLTMLDLLQSSWGQWKVDGEGVIRFNRKETLARFNETQKTLTAAADAQIALQRQVLEAQSQPSALPGRVPSSSSSSPAVVAPLNAVPRPAASPSPASKSGAR